MPRVSFHRLAERELNDAALHYDQESAGLGGAFLNEVEAYVESIVKNPIRAQRFVDRFGAVSLGGFHMEFFIR
jgi:hypothetical protein